MTQEEVRTLKVGDLVAWKDPDTGATTFEVVTENDCMSQYDPIHVQLRTIAVLEDPDDEYSVGDEGFIHNHNCVCLEKIA